MQPRSLIKDVLPSVLWQSCWQLQIIMLAAIVALLLTVTRFVTTIRFRRALSSKADIKRIPHLPYSIPIAGHAFQLGLDILGLNRDIAFVAFQNPDVFHCDADYEKRSISRPSSKTPSLHDGHLRCNRT